MKLVNWWTFTKPHRPGKLYVRGDIYNDDKCRFSNGSHIYTSSVVELDREAGILKTRNNTYKLENERVGK